MSLPQPSLFFEGWGDFGETQERGIGQNPGMNHLTAVADENLR
jgi:hypothetical protein